MTKSLLACVALVFVSACTAASPDPGQEAVLVRKPWLFGHGGVEATPVKTGRSWVAVTTQVWYVTTVPMLFTEHFDDLMSLDGVPLDFNASGLAIGTPEAPPGPHDNWSRKMTDERFDRAIRSPVDVDRDAFRHGIESLTRHRGRVHPHP